MGLRAECKERGWWTSVLASSLERLHDLCKGAAPSFSPVPVIVQVLPHALLVLHLACAEATPMPRWVATALQAALAQPNGGLVALLLEPPTAVAGWVRALAARLSCAGMLSDADEAAIKQKCQLDVQREAAIVPGGGLEAEGMLLTSDVQALVTLSLGFEGGRPGRQLFIHSLGPLVLLMQQARARDVCGVLKWPMMSAVELLEVLRSKGV